jgi:DNA-binding transcriptional MocR family regulator
MRNKTVSNKNQSVIGFFRALRVDPTTFPRTRPLYRRLAELCERAILRDDLTGGDRLPPERDLATALRVSRTSVVTAYRELESKGLVRGYVGRGTFVCARPDSASAPFSWRGKVSAAALQSTSSTVRDLVRYAADPSVISFAAGQPALDCFPTEAFRDAIDRVLERQALATLGLGPTEGQPRFRAAIAEAFGGTPDNILVLAGAQQGLDLLARCLVDPGDAVVVDRPGYLGAIESFRCAGARMVGWDIKRADLGELEELLLRYRPKLLFLTPTHQNPTGITLPIRVRHELLELAERYRLPIVEDDTYRELSLTSEPPPSLYALDEAHNIVIHLNSFSKVLAPGLRLGWISAVPPIVEQLTLIKQRVDPHTNNLSQFAVADLIESGAFERHVERLRGEHRRRRDAMVKALRQHVGNRLGFSVPDGGLYLWCQLTDHVRAQAVQDEAIRDSVVFVTGEPFYVDRGGAHELRLCYTAQPPERTGLAAMTLARSIDRARNATVPVVSAVFQ